jgi:hypothetical protein
VSTRGTSTCLLSHHSTPPSRSPGVTASDSFVRRDAAPPRVVARGAGTFILRNGQIMVSGPIVDRGRGDRTDTFAVVGGLGAYTAARGMVVSTEMRRRTRFLFTFAGRQTRSHRRRRRSGDPLPRAAELPDSSAEQPSQLVLVPRPTR